MAATRSLGDFLCFDRAIFALIALGLLVILFPQAVFAYTLADNPFVQGVTDMAEDFGPVVAGLGIVCGGARAGYCAFRKAGCDEMDYQKWDKGMKNAIIGGAICGGFGVVMTIVGNYFSFVA